MKLLIERIDITGAEKCLFAHTAFGFEPSVLNPLIDGQAVHSQAARGLTCVHKCETCWLIHDEFASYYLFSLYFVG
jgi:hypothetical protein